jgi:ribosome-binding protein aMBF1 (putative translation factor)
MNRKAEIEMLEHIKDLYERVEGLCPRVADAERKIEALEAKVRQLTAAFVNDHPRAVDAEYICDFCQQTRTGECWRVWDNDNQVQICPDCYAKIPTDDKPTPKRFTFRLSDAAEEYAKMAGGDTREVLMAAARNWYDAEHYILKQSARQSGKTAAYAQWRRDLAGGLRITSSPEPVPCPKCGQPVVEVTSTVGKGKEPAPAPKAEPDWKNAQYTTVDNNKSFSCAVCGEEHWGSCWMIAGSPDEICHDCYAKLKTPTPDEKPTPKRAKPTDEQAFCRDPWHATPPFSEPRACPSCGWAPDPAPKPSEVWMWRDLQGDVWPAQVIGASDTTASIQVWDSGQLERYSVARASLLRPATEAEARAFWGR